MFKGFNSHDLMRLDRMSRQRRFPFPKFSLQGDQSLPEPFPLVSTLRVDPLLPVPSALSKFLQSNAIQQSNAAGLDFDQLVIGHP